MFSLQPATAEPEVPKGHYLLSPERVEAAGALRLQQQALDEGYAAAITPASATKQPTVQTPAQPFTASPQPPQAQPTISGFGASLGTTPSHVGPLNSLDFRALLDISFEETTHLPEDAADDHVPLPAKTPKKQKKQHKKAPDTIQATIEHPPTSLPSPRIKTIDSHNPQQTAAPFAPPAPAQDHEMTLESPPNHGGSSNFGYIFAQAAPARANLFAQSTPAPSPVTAPPLTFSATPVAVSTPPSSVFAPLPSFSAPPASSPAPSLFFSTPTVSSAPPPTFSFLPATVSAPPVEAPAPAAVAPAFSVAAPPPALPAPVATPAPSLFTPNPPTGAPAPNMAVAAVSVPPGLLARPLPKFSLEALSPRKYPPMFSEKQKQQFRMAFRLISLDTGLKNHISSFSMISSDSECIRFHQEVKEIVLNEAARVIPGTRKRISDDNGQMNGYGNQTKRQAINFPTQSASTAPKPSAAPAMSGGKKRKADEQITKETYDEDGNDAFDEKSKKGRTSTEEGVSYPSLPSAESSNTGKKASSTAQLFKNLASPQTAEGGEKRKSVGSPSPLPNKTSTTMASSQKGPSSAFNPPLSKTNSNVPTPMFGSSSSASVNTPTTATNQSPFKVPTFAASSSQTTNESSFQFGAASGKANDPPAVKAPKFTTPSSKATEKPSFQFSASSSNANDKPTGSVPKFGESASDASQKPAFQVPKFGAQSSSIKDTPAGSVPKFGESASGTGQKSGFQVPKFGNPTNFLDAFSKKAATDEKKEKAKRKADEFDSDEDNEEEWERKDAERQAAKKQKVAELAKDEFKFKMSTTATSEKGKAPPPFSVSSSTTRSPTKNLGAEKTKDTPTPGRSIFDRIEKDTNGEPKRQMPPPEPNKSGFEFLSAPTSTPSSKPTSSSSTASPSSQNIFSASASSPSTQNIFSTPTNTSSIQNIFNATTAPTDQKTPEKKRLGGFGTPRENPEATKLFSGFSTSPNSGDNTWNPNTPIKFGTSQAAPAINITAATPTPAASSKQTSVLDSAVKPKPFAGFGQGLFSSTPATSSATPTLGFSSGVGFNFGAPPTSTSSLAPSNNASAATSRGTTPDTGGTSDEEVTPDEQINLASEGKGEETEETLFNGRARIQELDGETKKLETRGIGPLRLLKHKESGKCRLVGRIDSSGKVVLNAGLMPSIKYEKASEKQVRFGALNAQGRISTWVVRFKEGAMAEEFAKVCEESKNQ